MENNRSDRWGNRRVMRRAGTLPQLPTGVPVHTDSNITNNRIGPAGSPPCGPSAVYDCAGNLRSVLGTTADYDGENRVKNAAKGATTVVYDYDGDGRRVKSTMGAAASVFVNDAYGELAAEEWIQTMAHSDTAKRPETSGTFSTICYAGSSGCPDPE